MRNAALPVRTATPSGLAAILPVERCGEVPRERLAAIYSQHEQPASIAPGVPSVEQSVAERIRLSIPKAADLRRPILAYCDDLDGFVDTEALLLLRAWDWIAWPWYRRQAESLDALTARYKTTLRKMLAFGLPIVQVIGAHTRGFLSDLELQENIALCAEFARQQPRIVGSLWFANNRKDSLPSHTALEPSIDELESGCSTPAIVDVGPDTPDPKPPEPPETDMPFTEDEFKQTAADMAPAIGKFWGQNVTEATQGQREAWNAIRKASADQYDGSGADWAIGAGCRAKGASPEEREAWARGVVRLWQERAG
jgi:hypothetical protein